MPVEHLKNFDLSKVQLTSNVKEYNSKKAKYTLIQYGNDSSALKIHFPTMVLPYGVSNWKNDDGSEDLSIEIPFSDPPTDTKHAMILEKFSGLEDLVLDAAEKYSAAWELRPSPKKTKETYRGQFKGTLIKDKKNGDKKIVFKIVPAFGDVVVEDINKPGETFGLDYIARRSHVQLLADMSRVWLASNTFGVKLALTKVRIMKLGEDSNQAGFLDDPDDVAPVSSAVSPADQDPEEF